MLPGFIRLADYMLVEGLMLLAVGTGSSLRIRLKLEPRLLSSVRSCTQCHALITCHLKFTCMPMPMPMPTTTPTFNQAYINAHALIHPRSHAHNNKNTILTTRSGGIPEYTSSSEEEWRFCGE